MACGPEVFQQAGAKRCIAAILCLLLVGGACLAAFLLLLEAGPTPTPPPTPLPLPPPTTTTTTPIPTPPEPTCRQLDTQETCNQMEKCKWLARKQVCKNDYTETFDTN